MHPLGKSPVISDGDVVVAESGAIIEYLVEKYGQGKLIPAAQTTERRQYTYWLHYAEGSAMPPLLMSLVFRKLPQGAPLQPAFEIAAHTLFWAAALVTLITGAQYWEQMRKALAG